MWQGYVHIQGESIHETSWLWIEYRILFLVPRIQHVGWPTPSEHAWCGLVTGCETCHFQLVSIRCIWSWSFATDSPHLNKQLGLVTGCETGQFRLVSGVTPNIRTRLICCTSLFSSAGTRRCIWNWARRGYPARPTTSKSKTYRGDRRYIYIHIYTIYIHIYIFIYVR